MRCSNCNANVEYKTTACPVCGSAIDCCDKAQLYPTHEVVPMDTAAKSNAIKSVVLDIIILLSLIGIAISSFFIINKFVVVESFPLAALIAVVLMTIIITIKHTSRPKYSVGSRSLLFTLMSIAIIYLVGYVMNDFAFATCRLLPAPFFGVGGFLMLLCLCVDKRKYYFASVTYGVLSVIPIIVVAACNLDCLLFSITTAVLGLAMIILPSIACGRDLKHMYKTFFHI